jgi:hypothetical protein
LAAFQLFPHRPDSSAEEIAEVTGTIHHESRSLLLLEYYGCVVYCVNVVWNIPTVVRPFTGDVSAGPCMCGRVSLSRTSLCKTTDSTVMGTQYGHILRWMGIEHVVVCGLFTDQCVSSTVRDLSDLGYTVFLVEDATSAINADLQIWETRMLNQIYCKVVSTDEVLQDLATQ